ncbi:MAG: aminomethyl-transferring glycine dehydrogenase [Actinobacteria bacterium HGW-Actinobacteria-10]|nr:MAG: aminomethyl-transferring glycine dehydrogenase [Actinobacteria bacterium HGW-Actinobacteria-10]
MNYIPVTCEQREAMLRAVGVRNVSELFADVPHAARLTEPLALPDGMPEMGLVAHMEGLARANAPAVELVSFMGAGCYDHYIPAVVDHMTRKPEFFTAYTPYQPEISQGTLQAMWEYQSMICALTGATVSNASMYDGATAMVEAALMAARVTKRHRIVVSAGIHPEWRQTLDTYAEAGTLDVDIVPLGAGGSTDSDSLVAALEAGDVAAVIVASPGFLGVLEDIRNISQSASRGGALLVVATDPLLLGVLEPPARQGADIIVAEGQSLGGAMSLGGPGLGIFACDQKHVRQMPGRLVGRTVDVDGNTGFVLTLSTREQHIRREKATSNICSNHALNALAAGAYLAAMGGKGLAETAASCVAKAHYMHDALLDTGVFARIFDAPFGYEFALEYRGDVATMQEAMLEGGFLAGVSVGRMLWNSSAGIEGLDRERLERAVVFAVTEKRTRDEIDAFVGEVVGL